MIPSEAYAILSGEPRFKFDPDSAYAVSGLLLVELEQMMRRLFTEQRMTADEMRDWANLLYLRLGQSEDAKFPGASAPGDLPMEYSDEEHF